MASVIVNILRICAAFQTNRNALFIGRSSRHELLRISPLQLTKTIVYCVSRVIVFNASIIYFRALSLSPIFEVTLLLLAPKIDSQLCSTQCHHLLPRKAPLFSIIELHSIDATALPLLGKYNKLPRARL